MYIYIYIYYPPITYDDGRILGLRSFFLGKKLRSYLCTVVVFAVLCEVLRRTSCAINLQFLRTCTCDRYVWSDKERQVRRRQQPTRRVTDLGLGIPLWQWLLPPSSSLFLAFDPRIPPNPTASASSSPTSLFSPPPLGSGCRSGPPGGSPATPRSRWSWSPILALGSAISAAKAATMRTRRRRRTTTTTTGASISSCASSTASSTRSRAALAGPSDPFCPLRSPLNWFAPTFSYSRSWL